MALVEIVQALRENFCLRGCPVPILLGEQFLHDHGDASRIVIIPSADKFGPKSISVRPIDGAGYTNPRALFTRSVTATANLWAGALPQQDPNAQLDADFLVLDALVNIFCAALHSVAAGITTLSSGTNVTGQAIHDRRGLVYELVFSINVPIVDAPWPSIPVMCAQTFTPERVTADISVQESFDGGESFETVLQFEAPSVEETP